MWAVSQQRIMIRLHGRQSKGKRNGHDLSTMEKGGGTFPLPHASFALLACTKSFSTGFISNPCNKGHTHLEMTPPSPTPHFFQSYPFSGLPKRKIRGRRLTHYITGLQGTCFWDPLHAIHHVSDDLKLLFLCSSLQTISISCYDKLRWQELVHYIIAI